MDIFWTVRLHAQWWLTTKRSAAIGGVAPAVRRRLTERGSGNLAARQTDARGLRSRSGGRSPRFMLDTFTHCLVGRPACPFRKHQAGALGHPVGAAHPGVA